MKLHWGSKDGGPESRVRMYGIESKSYGSLLVLRFDDGSREAYHSHAFNALSWLLWGFLVEEYVEGVAPEAEPADECYEPSVRPIITMATRFHKVSSVGTSWVLSLRSPWYLNWIDKDMVTGRQVLMTSGRRVLVHV